MCRAARSTLRPMSPDMSPERAPRDGATAMSKSRKSAKQTPPAADGAPQIDIGLSAGDRRKIADGLSHFLADSFTLYLRTHNFHWNVTGPMFNTLHLMFEGQYTEEWTALDAVAERIRALGYRAPGAYAEFVKLGSIAEGGEVDAVGHQHVPAHLVRFLELCGQNDFFHFYLVCRSQFRSVCNDAFLSISFCIIPLRTFYQSYAPFSILRLELSSFVVQCKFRYWKITPFYSDTIEEQSYIIKTSGNTADSIK